jgi:hypothetical protein
MAQIHLATGQQEEEITTSVEGQGGMGGSVQELEIPDSILNNI